MIFKQTIKFFVKKVGIKKKLASDFLKSWNTQIFLFEPN